MSSVVRMLPRAGLPWLPLALSLVLVSCEVVQPVVTGPAGREFFASPTGSASGDGSLANPWDLATALAGPAAVTPGSTIWLRGGMYADGPYLGHGYLSDLTGTPDAPIVVRQYPGER